MRGQAVLADVWSINQAAHNHVPAHQALQTAKDEQPPELPLGCAINRFFGQEPDERDEEHDTDQPSPQAMDEFEPEDRFEILDRHPGVDFLELGILAVFFIERLPVGFIHRRDDAGEGSPFHN